MIVIPDRGTVERTKRAHSLIVALLFSFLLGSGPATASEIRLPRVETADSGKATIAVRSLKRVSEAPDDRDGPLLEPDEPRIHSLRPDTWPAGAVFDGAEIAHAGHFPASYHARAPPASLAV